MNFKPENIEPNSPYIESDGVRIYGERAQIVELSDVELLKIPQEAVLHVTRHLTELSGEVRERLIGTQIDDEGKTVIVDKEFISVQLESAGSKFNDKISDPEILIAVCREMMIEEVNAGQVSWIENSATGEMTAKFQAEPGDKYKEMLGLGSEEKLGTTSVVEITPNIQGQVEREPRGKGETKDQIEVNVVRGIPAPKTDNLIIVIKKQSKDSEPYFYTAYTGILAPSLPRPEKQSPDELKYNQEWWEKHAFVR
ncbi:hypothetical protein KJ733_01580 [Patescibacteria group bacterium]|nr:hypothetical protein [Patescibacteria group bacterium]